MRDGEKHVRPVIEAAGKGEGWTVAGVRRGEECNLVVVEGERLKGVVTWKDRRDLDVGRGIFVVVRGGREEEEDAKGIEEEGRGRARKGRGRESSRRRRTRRGAWWSWKGGSKKWNGRQ